MKHVMDNRCYSLSFMATWYAYCVYFWRINPYSARDCCYCDCGTAHSRQALAAASDGDQTGCCEKTGWLVEPTKKESSRGGLIKNKMLHNNRQDYPLTVYSVGNNLLTLAP